MRSIKYYIKEQLHEELCYMYDDINESGGLYKGQIELVSFLCDEFESYIANHKDKEFILTYKSLDKFDNVFFETLNIRYYIDVYRKNILGESSFFNITDKNNIGYNYNKSSNKLNEINISIYIPNNINNDLLEQLRGRLCHELNHCYTYYQIICNDIKEDTYNIEIPEKYKNTLTEWYDKSYKKIIEGISNHRDIAKLWSSLLIYTLTRYERNAFLAEIDTYIFDRRGDKIKTVDNVEKELSKCNQYNIYNIENFKILDIISNEWTKDQQDILKNTYNDIYNTNLSFKRIIYLLKEKNKNTVKKLNKNIKIIVGEYKSIPENIKEPVYEGYISYFKSPISKYLDWF